MNFNIISAWNSKKNKELDGELFFLRYIDPKPEIRIRIKCKDLFKAYNNILDILILSRENRVLYNFDIATYDKEIERYGGKELINLSEKVFCRDSDTILVYFWNQKIITI